MYLKSATCKTIAKDLLTASQILNAVVAGEPVDPTQAQALIENFNLVAEKLDPALFARDTAPTPGTVSLKYAHKKLCAPWCFDNRSPINPLFYQGKPIGTINDDLQSITLKTGVVVKDLSASTRLEK
jgi:hypothetical protein